MSYNDIPAGKDLPNDINVIIEIPANHDPIKYEVDKDSGSLFVDRFVAGLNSFGEMPLACEANAQIIEGSCDILRR